MTKSRSFHLIFALFFLINTIHSQSVVTRATTGYGLYKDYINWINWDLNNNGVADDDLTAGSSRTYTSPSGIVYTITLSNVKIYTGSSLNTSTGVVSYGTEITSGTNYIFMSAKTTDYYKNNFQNAYGGRTTDGWTNGNIIGMSNLYPATSAGNKNMVTFTITVVAKNPDGSLYNGTGIPKGIVMAGTETLSGSTEWEQMVVPSTGSLQILDKYIDTYYHKWSDFYLCLFQNSTTNPTSMLLTQTSSTLKGDGKGDVMMMATKTSTIDCMVHGGGGQHLAIGFIDASNYSQAPATYGEGVHLDVYKYTGGVVSSTNYVFNTQNDSTSTELGTYNTPLRLGAVDPVHYQYSPAASGADPATHTNGLHYADGLVSPNTFTNKYSITYTNTTTSSAYITLWIDKNRDGVFNNTTEKVEQKTIAAGATGTAVFDVSALKLPVAANYYGRFRLSTQSGLYPGGLITNGYAPDGEVEDYWLSQSSIHKETATICASGGTAISNVTSNDTISGVTVTLGTSGNASISQVGTWPTGITLDTITGAINVAAGTTAGTYSVTYQLCDKLSSKSCSTVADQITVLALPTAPVVSNRTYCRGESATALTATIPSGAVAQWYTASVGGTPSSTAPTPSTTTVGTFIWYVSSKSSSTGCESARIPITITIDGPNTPVITTTAASCGVAGTATITNYSATNTYTFTPTGPSVSSTGLISGLTAGTAYTVIASNTGGCTSVASASFSVGAAWAIPSAPTVSTATATNNCPSKTVDLSKLITSTTPANGTVSYKTTNDFAGTDVTNPFAVSAGTYYIFYENETHCYSSGTKVTVSILNCPPTDGDETASTLEDTPVSGTLLSNASDIDGDALTITSVSVAGSNNTVASTGTTTITIAAGTIQLNAAGSYTFSPAANWNGTVPTITYTVSDGKGGTDTSTLIITVTPVNDPPTAVNDSKTVNEDETVTISATNGLLNNDSDIDGDTYTITKVQLYDGNDGGTAGTLGQAFTGTYGVLTLKADGSYTYVANQNAAELLKTGETGTEQFQYTITDVNGATAKAVLTITIIGKSTAPVTADDYATTNEDVPVTVDITTNDHDFMLMKNTVDLDPSTPSVLDKTYTVANQGTFAVDANGIVTFTPVANFNGTVTPVAYTIQDNESLVSNTSYIHITVNPVNDPPVVSDFTKAGNYNTALNFLTTDFTGKYTDVENDALSTVKIVDLPANGTLTLYGNAIVAGQELTAAQLSSMVFTPATNWQGTTTFHWNASDGAQYAATSATAYVSIVDHSSDLSVSPFSKSGAEDQTISFSATDFSSKFTDISGGTLQNIKVATLPANGTLKLNGTAVTSMQVISVSDLGKLTFTPDANWNGSTTFNWNGSNGTSYPTALTYAQITITPVEDAPVATNDQNSAVQDQTISTSATTGVLSNDTDPDNDALTVTAVRTGAESGSGTTGSTGTALTGTYGTLTLNADGSYSYAANQAAAKALGAGVTAYDIFTYTMSDGKGGTDKAELNITITGSNDAPVAVNDTNSVYANQTIVGTLTSKGILLNDKDADGDALTITALRSGTVGGSGTAFPVGTKVTTPYGELTVNADGTCTYTANGAASLALKAGETAVRYVTYTVSDGKGGTDQAELVLTIIGVNKAPVAVDDVNNVTAGASVTTFSSSGVTSNDTDINGDALTVNSIRTGTETGTGTAGTPGTTLSGTYGTLTLNADGSYTYAADKATATALALGATATDVFTYGISDGQGGTDKAALTITITGKNDAPTAANDTYTTTANHSIAISPKANDSDPDAGDVLTVSAINGISIISGTTQYVETPEGTITVNPDGSMTYSPHSNYYGTSSFPYTVSDGKGGTATATITMNVTFVNHTPVAVNDSYSVSEDGAAITLSPTGNDTDTDGDALSVTYINGTALTPGTAQSIAVTGGIVGVSASGTITFTPNALFDGTVTFPYIISDGNGGTATANEIITVYAVNHAPVDISETVTTNEDVALSGNLLTNATDVDGDALKIKEIVYGTTTTTIPATGSATIAVTNGSLSVNAAGDYTFTPAANWNGTVPTVYYNLTDGNGSIVTSTLNITVTPVNDPPVDGSESFTIDEDESMYINLLANASDTDGDKLTIIDFSANGNTTAVASSGTTTVAFPDGTLSINAAGDYTFTSAKTNFNGAVPTITYTVSDGHGGTTTSTLNIYVTPVNDPPTAVNDTLSVPENGSLTLKPLVNDFDIDGDAIKITHINTVLLTPGTAQTIPVTHGTVNVAADGTITFVANAHYNGVVDFPYAITDGNGEYCTAEEVITVTSVNDSPVDGDETVTTAEDSPVTGKLLANATDADGDALTVTSVAVAGVNTPVATTGTTTISITGGILAISADGTYSFTPAANWNGIVPVISYTVSDGNGGTDLSTLTITVTPVNDPPTAVNDTNTATEDIPLTVTAANGVLANDSDIDNDTFTVTKIQVYDTDNMGTTGTVGSALTGTYGQLTINADGSYGYIANQAAAELLKAGETATESFQYSITDSNGASSQATLTFTIIGVSSAPVTADDATTTAEDTPVSLDITTNDHDFMLMKGTIDLDPSTPVQDKIFTIAGQGTFVVDQNGIVTFTPAANFNGTATANYTIRDNESMLSNTSTIAITVTPVNDPPVVSDFSKAGNLNTAFNFTATDFSNNYSDVEGAAISTIKIIDLPANGTLTLNGNTVNANDLISASDFSNLQYTPATGWEGTTTFHWNATDGSLYANKDATAYISIVNHSSEVHVDSLSKNGLEDQVILFAASDFTSNFTDDLSRSMTSIKVPTLPANGTLKLNGNAVTAMDVISISDLDKLTFTPDANWNGVTTFNWNGSNGLAYSNTMTFAQITISPVEDAPVASNDTTSVSQNQTITTTASTGVVVNDKDVDNDALTVTSIRTGAESGSGTSGTIGTSITGTYGTLTMNADGSYSYNADQAAAKVLAAGVSAWEQFTYTISDGKGGTDLAELDIKVVGTNDAPVAVNDRDTVYVYQTITSTTTLKGALINDSDVDGDALTISSARRGGISSSGSDMPIGIPFTTNTFGTVTINADGTYSYTANMPSSLALKAGESTTRQFTYTVSDGKGGTATAELDIVIIGVNTAPVAVNNTANVNEGDTLSVAKTNGVLINDTDVNGDALTVAAIRTGSESGSGTSGSIGTPLVGTYGTLTLNADGSYTYVADQAAANALASGATANETFTYGVSDGQGGSDAAELTITITGKNDAPVATTDTYSMNEDGTAITLSPLNGDTDVDTGDVLTISSINGTTLTPGTAQTIAVTGGTVNVSAAGAVTFTPTAHFNGTVTFPYIISDGQGETATANQTITIVAVNDAPIANNDVYAMNEEDPALQLTPKQNDTDADNDILTITSIGGTAVIPGTSQFIPVTGGTILYSLDGTLFFTPTANYHGTTDVPYTISDGNGGTASANIHINIASVNDAPVAVNDTYSMNEDGAAITLSPLNGDSDADADAITITSIGGITIIPGTVQSIPVAGGSVGIAADGTISFAPDANANGTVTIPYTISDGTLSATANEVITIVAVNDAPVATDDSYTMDEDGAAISISPLSADYDVDGDAINITSINGVALTPGTAQNITVTGGVVNIAADGATLFSPDANYNGLVTFPYIISDGTLTATANERITINSINDVPEAVDDTLVVYSGDWILANPSKNLLSNDYDADGDPFTITAVRRGHELGSGTSFAVGASNGSNYGSIVINADGTYSFRAHKAGSIALKEGEVAYVISTYTITDSHGATCNGEFVVKIIGKNDSPTANNDINAVTAGQTITAPATNGLITNDTDPDNDVLSVSAIRTGAETATGTIGSVGTTLTGIYGTLTLNTDGSYSYTADQPAATALGLGATATETFSYTASDVLGLTDVAELNITVTGINDVPIAKNDTCNTNEDSSAISISPVSNDTDIDSGDKLAITSISGTTLTPGIAQTIAVTGGIITIAPDGSITYTPSANYNGTAVIPYVIEDGHGGTANANIVAVVASVNDAPVALNDNYAMNEDGNAITLTPLTADYDVDGDVISITSINGVALTPGTAQIITVTGGVVNIAADGTNSFTPATDYNGIVTIPYTISDGNGGTASANELITISPVNDAPVTVNDNYSMNEDGAAITLSPLNGDSDVDNDPLTIISINGTTLTPGTAQTILVVGGVVNVAIDGTITFTPSPDFNGDAKFPYIIGDGQGATTSGQEIVSVIAVNDVPVAIADKYEMNEDDTAITLSPLTSDYDVDNESLSIISINGTALTPGTAQTIAVSGGTVNVSAAGAITFSPTANFNGTVTFPYVISDGHGATATANEMITVVAVNDPPVAVNDTYSMNEDGTAITLNPLNGDTDVDTGDVLTITGINGIALTPGTAQTIAVTGGTVNVSAAGAITFSPTANFNGTVTFPYVISDGHGGTATANEIITVAAVNDTPVAVNDTYSMNEDGAAITLNPLNGDTDADTGDVLTITGINGTALTPGTAQTIAVTGGTVNVSAAGAITFSPTANFNGTVTFPYVISDGHGGTATANEIITVAAVNDTPVAVNDTYSMNEDGTAITLNPLNGDTDADTGDVLTITGINGTALTPGTAQTIAVTGGTVNVSAAGAITFTPTTNFNGTVTFPYVISDGHGGTATANEMITVVAVNDPPVAVNDQGTLNENTSIVINVLSNDTDKDNDKLTITSSSTPTNGTVTINSDQTVTYTPNTGFYGNDTFTYTVSDGKGGTSTATVMITVIALPDVLKSSSKAELMSDGTYTWHYTLVIQNNKGYALSSVQLVDDLDNVFKASGCTYSVSAITATGQLKANGLFNGSSVTNTLIDNQTMSANSTDSITITVNVNPNGYVGTVYNSAILSGYNSSTGLTIQNVKSDDPGISGTNDPTPTTINEILITVPDGFSPNGDYKNNNFVIVHPDTYRIEIEIVNRWGNTVYKSNDYQNNWDGTGSGNFIGNKLPDGTYYCIYRAYNKSTGSLEHKGMKYITLRR